MDDFAVTRARVLGAGHSVGRSSLFQLALEPLSGAELVIILIFSRGSISVPSSILCFEMTPPPCVPFCPSPSDSVTQRCLRGWG